MTIPPIVIAPAIRNYHPNPTFDDEISGYAVGSTGLTFTHDETGGIDNSGALQADADGSSAFMVVFLSCNNGIFPAEPMTYTGQVMASFPAGLTVRASLYFFYTDSSNSEQGRVDYTASGDYEHIVRTATSDPSKTVNNVMMRFQISTGSVARTARFDNVQIEEGDTASPFVIGTRPERRLPGYMDLGSTHITMLTPH